MTSAFGKVILLGEHAVVHGHPALAGAIDRGVSCHVHNGSGPPASLRVDAWGLSARAGEPGPVGAAIDAIVSELGVRDRPLEIVGDTTLPPGAGLGSSAALSVAMVRAIADHLGRALADTEVERIAGEAERCFHDNPSGIDVALAARGGLGVYVRGHGLTRLPVAAIRIVIGLSGEPRRTADMVRRVGDALAREPEPTRARFQVIADAVATGITALTTGEPGGLGQAMRRAQTALAGLGLSTPRIDHMVDAAERAGAFGAKLTGAGGGGAVIAYAPSREAEVERAWTDLGYTAFACTLGAQ